jgi:hypothetical protein
LRQRIESTLDISQAILRAIGRPRESVSPRTGKESPGMLAAA